MDSKIQQIDAMSINSIKLYMVENKILELGMRDL